MEPSAPGSSDATRTAASASHPTLAFGSYRLLQKIGEGGMGEVWLAEQTRPVRRQVAVKITKAASTAAAAGRGAGYFACPLGTFAFSSSNQFSMRCRRRGARSSSPTCTTKKRWPSGLTSKDLVH